MADKVRWNKAPYTVAELVELRKANMSWKHIGKRYNRGARTVVEYFSRNATGEDRKYLSRIQLTAPYTPADIIRMRESGLSWDKIREQSGTNRCPIYFFHHNASLEELLYMERTIPRVNSYAPYKRTLEQLELHWQVVEMGRRGLLPKLIAYNTKLPVNTVYYILRKTKVVSSAVRAERDARIWERMKAGEKLKVVAADENLGTERVRQICREYANA